MMSSNMDLSRTRYSNLATSLIETEIHLIASEKAEKIPKSENKKGVDSSG